MLTLTVKYSRDAYLPELQDLVDNGYFVDVRGRKTMELLNYVTVVTEPWHHCIIIPSRRWNPWLAMSEALWILAGREDVEALKPYNSHISDYSDNGSTLYGAYGRRLYDQIDPLIERLKRDPSDRRAVLSIWRNENGGFPRTNDLVVESKDPPCNNMVYFKLRENKLHMTVINRSNDIHYGLYAVNLPTFGILQAYIAARLGVEMGTQTHFSNSLHVYTDDPRSCEITDRMLYTGSEDLPVYPEHEKVFDVNGLDQIKSHAEFAKICSSVLDGDNPPRAGMKYPLFLAFAGQFLKTYKSKQIPIITAFPEFQDWILAGQMFAREVWK